MATILGWLLLTVAIWAYVVESRGKARREKEWGEKLREAQERDARRELTKR